MSEQNSKIAEMLDHLVNDDTAKAEELFHEYVVEKSRDIYEGLIEDEVEEATKEDDEAVEEASEDKEEDAVEEASEDKEEDAVEEASDNKDDEAVEEGFDEIEVEEGDDEDAPDATDDMMGDVEDGEEGEEGGDEPATKDDVMDLKDAIDDLEAAFKEYTDSEAPADEPEMDDMEAIQPELEASEEGDLETVREYVEKVDGHGAEKKGKAETADNTASPVAGANDMGGTTANIAKGGEGGGSETGLTGKAKDMNT